MLTYLPAVMQVVLVLIVMTAGIYDLRYRRIPNWLVLVGLVLGFGFNTFPSIWPASPGRGSEWVSRF